MNSNRIPSLLLVVFLPIALVWTRSEAIEIDAYADFSTSGQYYGSASQTSADLAIQSLVNATVTGDTPGDFASAFASATPGSPEHPPGTIGVGLSTSGSSGRTHADASASLKEGWSCSSCGAPAGFEYPVTYLIHLSGTLSPDWFAPSLTDYYYFVGSLSIDVNSFTFSLGATSLDATYCDGHTGVCTAVPLATTTLTDGSIAFDDTESFDGFFLGGVDTSMALEAAWDPVTGASSLGFLNTFGFDIVSNSDAVWNSDGGRSSIARGPTAVPEPAAPCLLAIGLAGIGAMRKRRPAVLARSSDA